MKTLKAFLIYGFLILSNFGLSNNNILNAQNNSNYNREIENLFDKAYDNLFSKNEDSAYYYFNRIKFVASQKKDWMNAIDAVMLSNEFARENNKLDKVKNNLTFLDSLFINQKSYLDTIPGINIYKNELSHQKGSYYFLLNDFERSRKAYFEIIKSTENLPDSLMTGDYLQNTSYLSTAYSYIAKMYSDEGKLDLAKQYYDKNIRFLALKNPDDKQRLYENYSLIAEVYKRQQEYRISNSYLNKTVDFYTKNKNNSSIPSILNIAQNHIQLSQLDSATIYLNEANKILEPQDPQLTSYFQVSAEIDQAKGNYNLALNDFKSALELTRKKWNHKKHWEIAHILNKIGMLHSQFGQTEKAIQNYNMAIDQLSESSSAFNQAVLLKVLKNKAEVINELKDSTKYNLTISIVNQGIKILDTLKPSFKSQEDKLLLIENAFPLFEYGLKAAFKLYKSTNDEKFLELAFHYSEKSKAVILMEAVLGAKATKFANIPSSILEHESRLKTQITFTEKQIANSKEKKPSLDDELFDLKDDYRELVQEIEKKYKLYFELKYKSETISILETQELLSNDEKLISYFYGNDAIYIISIEKHFKQIEQVVLTNAFIKEIKKLNQMLGDPKSDQQILGKLSYIFYKNLLAPILKVSDKKKIIIIPDGLLNYIPFAAINTKTSGIHYLIENHSIGYSNSATLLSQLRERRIKKPNILAFAPSFNSQYSNGRNTLLSLPNNKKEVINILNSFQGRYFTDKEASIENFRNELGNFGIVHLATHAIFNDASPDDSYLAFTPADNKDYLLYVRDLYNLNLNADMVTLSACESGLGEIRRGEGFLSLSRGFFYSGASSICSTLWKINDASSTLLMDSFYINLSEGNSKDLALKNAQLKFLNSNRNNALSHPYYWSGFIVSGNMNPVVNNTLWLWIVLSIALLALFGGIIYRRKKLIR